MKYPIHLVSINEGNYLIGAPISDREACSSERPQHSVVLGSYAIMEHPVRISDFHNFILETSYRPSTSALFFDGDNWVMDELTWEDPGYSYTQDCPVTCVNFWDVLEFTKWFRNKTGMPYRLPNEAEWEVAARAGTVTSRFWGNSMENAHRYANVSPNKQYKWVSPVKSFASNPWGLFDMLGNVFEWTASNFKDPYDGSELKSSTSQRLKCYRGGSFKAEAAIVRCSARAGMPPDLASNQIGFRLCLSLSSRISKDNDFLNLKEKINKLEFGDSISIKIKID